MFEEDLSVFFDDNEFATSAMLDGVPVTGIFYKRYADISDIATNSPALKLPSALALCVKPNESQLLVGDAFTGQVYTVVAIEPSGAGTSLLKLRKA